MSDPTGAIARTDNHGSPPRTITDRLFEALAFGLLLACFGGLFGSLWWIADLANHFRPHLLPFTIIAAALALRAGKRRWLLPLTIAVAIHAWIVMPVLLFHDNRPVRSDVPALTFVAINVHTVNTAHDEVVRFLEGTDTDLILIQETDTTWEAAITAGLPEYATLISEPRGDNFGIMLLARRAIMHDTAGLRVDTVRIIDISGGRWSVPTIELHAHWHGEPLALLGVHTLPPVSAQTTAARDAQLRGAAQWARDRDTTQVAVIVAGDLNATPWCPIFRDFQSKGGLLNSMSGFGLQGSWHASLPGLLQLPIDHCLHNRTLVTMEREVGSGSERLGSDHRPVRVKLGWAAEDEAAH